MFKYNIETVANMILEEIANYTRIRVEEQKRKIPLEEVKTKALNMNLNTGFPFEEALRQGHLSFICEVKKASPSKGIIAAEFPYLAIAKEYEEAGAAAISVLTEPKFFQGSDEYLKEISENVSIPVLRKDFTIDSYQIYESKLLGASAILLICELLDLETLKEYLNLAHSLGLSALVESHTKEEMNKALKAGARIIGVNNRDLKTFEVDINTSVELKQFVPGDKIYVSESGIKSPQDIKVLKDCHVNAVLIGETLMKCKDKKLQLSILRGE